MAKEHELKSHISSVYDAINAVSVENFNLLREKLGTVTSVIPTYPISAQSTLLSTLNVVDTKLPNTLETSVMELPLLEAETIEEISGGVYGNGIYVAITDCNSDIVLVSTTGQKWKKIRTGLKGYRNQICFVNGYFVTASYNEMWYEYSKDGITWVRKQLTFIPTYICATDTVLYFISVTEASSKYTIKVQYTTNIETPTFTELTYAVPEYFTGDYNNNSNRCIVLSNKHIVLLGNSSCISIVKSATEFTVQQIAANMQYALPVILKSDDGIRKGILYRYSATDTLMYIKSNGEEITYNTLSVNDVNITKDTIAIMLDRAWDETNDTGYMVINKDAVYTNTKLLKTNLYAGSRDFSGSGWENTNEVSIIPNAYNGLSAYTSTLKWKCYFKVINASAGEQYRLSCYVKTTNKDTITVSARYGENDINTGKIKYINTSHTKPSENNKWEYVWVTFEVTGSGTIRPAVFSETNGVEYSVCGMVLEKIIGDGSNNVFKDPINYNSSAWVSRQYFQVATEKLFSLPVFTKSNTYGGITQILPVMEGETYQYTAYIKASQANSVAFTTNAGASGTALTTNSWIQDIGVTTEWKKISYTIKVTKSGTIRPAFECTIAGVQHWITGMTLEKISQISFTTDLTKSVCIYGEHSFIFPKKDFTKVTIAEYISKKSLVDDTSDMYTMSLDDSIRNIPLMLENVANGYKRNGYYRVANGNFTVSSGASIDIVLPTKAEMLLIYAKTYFVKVVNEEGQFQNYLYDANQEILEERRAEVIRQVSGKYIIEYNKETKIVDNGFHFINTSEFTEFAYVAICSKIGNAYTVEEPVLEPFEVLTMKDVTYSKVLCVRDNLVIGSSATGKDLILSYGSSNVTKNIIPTAETLKITSAICTTDNKIYIGTDTNRIYVGTISSSNVIDNLSVYTLPSGASINFFGSIVYNNEIVLFAVGPNMTQIYYKTLSETAWTKYTGYTDAKTLKEVITYDDTIYLIPTTSKYIITIRKGSTGYVASTVNVATEDITWGGCIVNSSTICMIDNTSAYLYSTEKGTSSAFKKSAIGTYDTTFVRGMYVNGLYYIFLKDSKKCYGIYSSNLQNWTELEIIDKAIYSNVRMSLNSVWYSNNYFILSMMGDGLSLSIYEGTRDFSGDKWINKSLFTFTPNGYMGLTVATAAHRYSGMRQKINAVEGEIYRFSGYAKSTSKSINIDPIPGGDIPTNAKLTIVTQKIKTLSDGWSEYTAEFGIIKGGEIAPSIHKSTADSVPYSVCGFSLEKLSSMYEVYGSRVDTPVMLCVNGVEMRNNVVHRLTTYGDTAKLTFYNYQTKSFIPLADITNLKIQGTGATLSNGIITFMTVGTTVIYYTYNGINYTNMVAYRPIPTDVQLTLPERLYLNEITNIAVQPFPTNTTYNNLSSSVTKGSATITFENGKAIITPKQTGLLGVRIYMNLENGTQIYKDLELPVYEKVYPSDITVVYAQSYIHAGTSITPKITYVWPKTGEYIQQMTGTEISLTAPTAIIDKVRIDSNGKLTLDNFDFTVSQVLVVTVKTLNNITKQVSINTVRTISDITVENDLLISSPYDYTATGTHHVDINYTPSAITEPDLLFVSKIMPSETHPDKIPYGISMGSFTNGLLGVDIGTNWHPGEGILEIYRGPKSANPNTIMKKINIVYPHIRNTNVVNTEDNLFTTSRLYHICPLEDTLLVLIIGTLYILEVSKIDYHIIRRIELPSKISPVLNKLFYLDGVFTLTSDGFTTDSTGTPTTGHGQIWCSVDLINWTNYGNLAPLFGAYTNVNRVKIVDKKLIFLCTGKILYCKIDWDTARTSFYPTCGSLSTTNTSMSTYEWIDCACGSRLVFLASGGQYIMVGGFSSTLSSTIVSGYTVTTLNMAGNGRKWKCVGYVKQSFVFMAIDGTMELINHHLKYMHTSLVLAGMPAATDILDMWLINNNDALLLFIGAYTNTQYYYSSYYALWDGLSSTHAITGKKLNLALSDGKIYSINQRENMYNEVSPVAVCQAYYSNTVPSKLLETGQTFTKCIYVDNMYIALSGKRIYVCNDSLISYYEYPDADITSFNDIYPGLWLSDIVVYSNTSRKFIVLNLSLTTTIDIYTRVFDIGIDIVEITDVFYNGHNLKFIVKLDTNVYRLLSTNDYQTFTNTNIGTAAYSRMRGVFVEQYAVIIGKPSASVWTLYSVGGSSLVLSTLAVMSNHIPTSNTCKAVYGNRRILFVFEKSMAYKETSSDAALNINLPYNINTILYETATFNCGIFAVLATNSMNEYYILLSKDCETWTRRKLDSIDTYTSLMILPNNTIQIMNSNGKFYNYKISYTRYGSNTSNITETGYTFSTFGLNPSTTVRRIKSIDEYHFVMFNSPSANSLFYVSSNMEIKVLKLSGSETIVDVFVFQLKYLIATKTTCYVLTQDSSGNLTNPVEISASTFTNYQYIKDLIDNNQQIVDSISPYSPVNKNHDYLRNTFHAVCKQADGSLIYKTDKVVVSLPGNAAYAVKMIRESRGNNDLILTKDANGDYLTKIGSLGYNTHLTYPAGEIMDFAAINDSIVILSNRNAIVRFPTKLDWYTGSVYWLPENVVSKYPKLLVDDNRFILCAVDLVYESFDGITWKKDNIGTAAGDLYSNYVIIGGNVMQRWVFNTSNGNFKRYDIMKNR